jgi:hypothetical protein
MPARSPSDRPSPSPRNVAMACGTASTSPGKRKSVRKRMASGAAPSTSPGPTRAPTAVAAFATGAVPLSDVVDHPREGPPGRTPPPQSSTDVVVSRWVAVAVVGGKVICALPREEERPRVVGGQRPLQVVPLLRRHVIPEVVIYCHGPLVPRQHMRDRQAAAAKHPSPRTSHVRRDG